ncbi:MAG: DUF11 domain-containing protein [Oscillochloris sp.]|nr:DUF11 domain-containing protein [Oscillochloris sp.]
MADPVIVKSANMSTVQVGDTVSFTLIATNPGNTTASDVIVEDALPAFLSLDSASATRGDVQINGSSVRVVIGDLSAGETVSITVTARVITAAEQPNNRNIATLTTSSATDNPDNNRSEVSLIVNQPEPPATLPNTSGSEDLIVSALLVLGLALISASLVARRHQS